MKVFEREYANHYDLFYKDKDYEAECDFVEEIFRKFDVSVSILDLGCGTGGHATPLAQRGYQVTGVDLSEKMLTHARQKAKEIKLDGEITPPIFRQGDVRSVHLGQKFDSVLMMFAVLGYQWTNDDVLAALHTVRSHLNPGGLFICDVWYGPAVLAIRPSDRVKVIPTEDGKVIRAVSGSLDVYRQLATVNYNVWHIIGHQVVSESEESHQIRFFFAQELSLFMQPTKLEIVEMRSFDNSKRAPDESSWNVWVVAR